MRSDRSKPQTKKAQTKMKTGQQAIETMGDVPARTEAESDKQFAKSLVQRLNKAQHSPLPWSESAGIITAGPNPGQPYIADCRFGPEEIRGANIRHIMSSVNHADKLAEALRDCVTSPGALAERSHEYALRRLKTITDTATEALSAYEAA